MKFLSPLLLAFAVSASRVELLKRQSAPGISTKIIPSAEATGPIVANFISQSTGLDSSQISAVNASSWDWWYFDAISPDLKTSITVIFFTAFSTGFATLQPSTDADLINIQYTFENGTGGNIQVDATEAIIETIDNSASGIWTGTGGSFVGAPDLSTYVIRLDNPQIKGTFTLKTTSPPHYPCGPAVAGQDMQVIPHIGWSNAIPDANGIIDFEIGGTKLKFNGVAYHDKNWSDKPFFIDSWYWGHGRLGPYALVWFDAIDSTGIEHVSGYAAKDGKIVTASCTNSSVKVRPVNSKYPPSQASPDPEAYTIRLDLGEEGILSVNVTTEAVLVEGAPVYMRWAGSLTGSVDGGVVMSGGVGLYEQFKLV